MPFPPLGAVMIQPVLRPLSGERRLPLMLITKVKTASEVSAFIAVLLSGIALFPPTAADNAANVFQRQTWFEENDPEGVAFEYDVLDGTGQQN